MANVLCVGIGHVGLPLALKLWLAGHTVSAVDIDADKIEALKAGIMPFREEGCDTLLDDAHSDPRFRPLIYSSTGFPAAVSAAEYIVLTLGTPLGVDYSFRFDQYFDVLDRLLPHLSPGVTLVVRSTVAPLFTRNVVAARVASRRDWVPGQDFFPSFCPERLLQGAALGDIEDLPEIIGADDDETARRAAALMQSLGTHKQCLRLSTVEAELSKLFLNTFRYTLFGLANEFALTAEHYGADIFAVLEAANAGYPRGGIPRPGPSRGPCLGKDTSALAFSSTTSLIAHAALKTNENLVLHVVNEVRAALGSFAHRRVGVVGLAFKAGTDDTRDNLSVPLINMLDREGATTVVYDPLVPDHNDPSVLQGCDALILMTAHDEIRRLRQSDVVALCDRPREAIFIFDLWNVWPWADRILGKGTNTDYEDSGDGSSRLPYAGGHPASAGSRT